MNFFVNSDQIKENKIYICNSDVNHIKNVLRKKPGDVITIVSDGAKYRSEIVSLSSDCVVCNIIEESQEITCEPVLTIFQGLAKADKMEYIIQKCTELGVHEIVPLELKRCVVRLDGKDKAKKLERWKKIAEVASKQSLRNDILRVERVLDLSQAIDVFDEFDYVIVAYEKELDVTLKSVIRGIEKECPRIAVVIGPEGGIDDEEVQRMLGANAVCVSLGKRILRTETAPVVISSILMYEFSQ